MSEIFFLYFNELWTFSYLVVCWGCFCLLTFVCITFSKSVYIYIHIYHITQYENSRRIVSILQFSTILENFQIFHHFLYCLQPIVLSTLLPAPTIAYLCSTAPYVMLTSLSGVVTLKKKKLWEALIYSNKYFKFLFCNVL